MPEIEFTPLETPIEKAKVLSPSDIGQLVLLQHKHGRSIGETIAQTALVASLHKRAVITKRPQGVVGECGVITAPFYEGETLTQLGAASDGRPVYEFYAMAVYAPHQQEYWDLNSQLEKVGL